MESIQLIATHVGSLKAVDVILIALATATLAILLARGLRCLAALTAGGRHRKVKEISTDDAPVPFVGRQVGDPAGGHVGFELAPILPADRQRQRARQFLGLLQMRRSLRFYDPRPVDEEVLRACIAAAGTAPSGAHQQPWSFVVVKSAAARQRIRDAVEHEEQINYDRRMRKEWVADVEGLVSGLHQKAEDGREQVVKPYLTEAPALVVVFMKTKLEDDEGNQHAVYYPKEGVGIATGMFIAALQNVGLCTLTSTPMGAEKAIRAACGRPDTEKVFLLMPVGFPARDATVPFRDPARPRKALEEILFEA